MLELHLRDKNNVINMTIPNKSQLSGRRGHSAFYHNSNDYLCAALGVCSGGVIVDYCRFNDINVKIFERILVSVTDENFIITISCPKDFSETNKTRLNSKLINCTIAKLLNKEVKVMWENNTMKTKDLVKEMKGCCGDKS